MRFDYPADPVNENGSVCKSLSVKIRLYWDAKRQRRPGPAINDDIL